MSERIDDDSAQLDRARSKNLALLYQRSSHVCPGFFYSFGYQPDLLPCFYQHTITARIRVVILKAVAMTVLSAAISSALAVRQNDLTLTSAHLQHQDEAVVSANLRDLRLFLCLEGHWVT